MIPFVLGVLAAASFGQSWLTAYESGIASARGGSWEAARESFKQAAAYRTEDVSGATVLPGPATERKKWRNGAPYSPNFLAAYCAYRIAQASAQQQARVANLNAAASEWSALIAKNQVSYETAYFLAETYTQLGNMQKRSELEQRLQGMGSAIWKVDTEVVLPEELAAVAQLSGKPAVTPDTTTKPSETNPPKGNVPTTSPFSLAKVPIVTTKYALVIGNSEGRISGTSVPFAGEDAMLVREALVNSAGYAEANIDLVQNAGSSQLRAAAKALADRIPEGATVFLFFSGSAANVDGKDYFCGVESESTSDTASMVAKSEIYSMFIAKGARVFAFYETNRPIANGRYFGMEVPMFGSVAQSQGTIPGEGIGSLLYNGRAVGQYAHALATVIGDFKSNRIPIHEFGWQVFYKIRKGDTGDVPGASRQIPTLPVLTNMAADARF